MMCPARGNKKGAIPVYLKATEGLTDALSEQTEWLVYPTLPSGNGGEIDPEVAALRHNAEAYGGSDGESFDHSAIRVTEDGVHTFGFVHTKGN